MPVSGFITSEYAANMEYIEKESIRFAGYLPESGYYNANLKVATIITPLLCLYIR